MRIKKNIGRLDRTLRVIVGLSLLLIGLFLQKGQILSIVFGLVMLGISLIGFCPVYVPFGISTRKGN
jgi:hypothetical protein